MHITEQPDISQIVKLCCNYHQSIILSFLYMFDIKTVLCFSTQGRLNSKISVTGHLTFGHVQRAVKICQYYLGFACLACNVATNSSYQQNFYTAEMALPLVFEDTDMTNIRADNIKERPEPMQFYNSTKMWSWHCESNAGRLFHTSSFTGRWSVAVFWNLLDTMYLRAPVYNYSIIFITFLY